VTRLRGLLFDTTPLREHRDFRLIWFGQVLSGFGRQVTVIALPYQLYVLTGSPLAIGALAAIQLVPLVLLSMWGGSLADMVDRRKLLLVTQTLLAATSAALAGLATFGSPPLWAIYLVAVIATSVSAFDQPARSSAVPRLVPMERLTSAIAANHVAFQGSAIAGPALGGILIGTLGLPAAYLIDVCTFGASITALVLIHPIPPLGGVGRMGAGAVREGLRFAFRSPLILSTYVIDLNAMIFGMPTALFPLLALDVFKAGPEGVGLLAAAPAAGAFVGALLTGWVGRVRHQGRAVYAAVAGWGLAITGFGLATFSFPLALLLLAGAGAADMSAVFRATIYQQVTPDRLRGRLAALQIIVVTGGPRIGDMEASAVAALVGAQLSVISGGVLCLLGLAAVAWLFPQLAAYDVRAPVAVPDDALTASVGVTDAG
jgi:MFS family permease